MIKKCYFVLLLIIKISSLFSQNYDSLISSEIKYYNSYSNSTQQNHDFYSITQTSINTVKSLSESLIVKIFFSDNIPEPYDKIAINLTDILNEYIRYSNNNFSYQFYNMKNPENQKIASNSGLRQIQIQEVKNNEVTSYQVWMGLTINYGSLIGKIDGITSISGFEYNLTTKISKMIAQADTLSGLSAGDSIRVTLYASDNLKQFRITGFDDINKLTQTAFNSVNLMNKNRLYFETKDPEGEEMETAADYYGLQLFSWENKDGTEGKGIFGLVIEHNGAFRQVPLSIQRSFFGYGIAGASDIEENLSASLESLLSKSTEIAYITGHGEADLVDTNGTELNFQKILSDSYTLKELKLSEENIPLSINTVIINGPKQTYTDEELYKLDQFLLKGGNLMVFADPFDVEQGNYYQGPSYNPIDTGLNKILEKYGIKLEQNYVFDEGCYTYNQQGYGNIKMYWAPMLARQQLNQKSVITKNLGYVIMLQPGEITTDEAENNKDLKVSVLAKTSPQSWTLTQNFDIGANMQTPYDKSVYKPHKLAVLVEGKFPSAFENNPSEKEDSSAELDTRTHLSKGTQTGRILAVNTSYVTSNQLIDESGNQPIAMMIRNSVDYMSGNNDLCTMRTNGFSLNTHFDEPQ